jgi:hypothetical protein
MSDNLMSLHDDEKIRNSVTSKVEPTDDVSLEVKKEAPWCIAWAEAIYAKFLCNQSYTSIEQIRRMEELRLYGAGAQPRDKYMDILIGGVNENPNREGYYNVDWEIFSPMPAFKRKVMGRLETQDHKIRVSAVDSLSGEERENMMWDNWFESQYGGLVQQIQEMAGIQPMAEPKKYIAESMEELEAFNSVGGFKLKHEIDMEKAIDYTEYVSDFKEIKRKLISDLVDIGCAAYRDFIDVDGVEKYEYVDFARLIVDYDRENSFKKSRFWGYLKFYTISEVRSWRPDLPEKQLMSLARTFANRLGNPIWTWDFQNVVDYRDPIANAYIYDNYRVAVLLCEWQSIDYNYKTLRKTKYGTEIYAKSEHGQVLNSDKKKTKVTTVPNIYFCDWIVGTNETLRHGQQYDIPRSGKKRTPRLSLHAYALPGKSIVESGRNNLDQIQLAFLKLQNALAMASPAGLEIEITALNNINLGDGELKPIDLINLKRATGDVVYRATTHAGKYNAPAGKPIGRSEGGIGGLLNEIVQIFEINFQFLSELTGIDRVSAVAQKSGESTATEAKLSVAATSDSVQPVYAAYTTLKEMGAKNACDRIQIQIKYGDGYDVYYPIMGKSSMEMFKISKESADRVYGLKVEALPSNEFKNIILQAATEALKPGKDGENISYADYLMIVGMIDKGMLKQAQMVLSFRLEKRKKQALQLQRENITLQAQQTQELEQMKFKKELVLELVKHMSNKELANDQSYNQMKQALVQGFVLPMLMPQQQGPEEGQEMPEEQQQQPQMQEDPLGLRG